MGPGAALDWSNGTPRKSGGSHTATAEGCDADGEQSRVAPEAKAARMPGEKWAVKRWEEMVGEGYGGGVLSISVVKAVVSGLGPVGVRWKASAMVEVKDWTWDS